MLRRRPYVVVSFMRRSGAKDRECATVSSTSSRKFATPTAPAAAQGKLDLAKPILWSSGTGCRRGLCVRTGGCGIFRPDHHVISSTLRQYLQEPPVSSLASLRPFSLWQNSRNSDELVHNPTCRKSSSATNGFQHYGTQSMLNAIQLAFLSAWSLTLLSSASIKTEATHQSHIALLSFFQGSDWHAESKTWRRPPHSNPMWKLGKARSRK